MAQYSKQAILMAQELSAKACERLVNDFGYTVWANVATHKVYTQRPQNYTEGYYCTKNHSRGYMQSANVHHHPGVPRAPRVENPRRNFWQWLRSIWSVRR